MPGLGVHAATGRPVIDLTSRVVDPRLDLRALLDAVEAAPPAAGVDALAAELALRVGAREVSFLIADIHGRDVVRVARASERGQLVRPR